MDTAKALEKFVTCEDLQEVWSVLVDFLSRVGFDRVIFAHRDSLSEANFHNHYNMVLFSTYGKKLDKLFVEDRLYVNSPTVRWALENAGWMSWGETERRASANSLSPKEAEVFNVMYNLGLRAGYTYSVPFKRNARHRSIFGLAVPIDVSQEYTDWLMTENQAQIEHMLLAFVLAVSKFTKVEPGQMLSPVQARTLSLLAEGRTLSEIAEREAVHFRTIDKRLSQARRILEANNSLHAAILAERSGQLMVVRD